MKWLPWIVIAGLVLVIVFQCRQNKETVRGTVYDTVPIYDTITHDSVIPRDSVVLRYEVVRLSIASPKADSLITPDSVQVVIPITQQYYKEEYFEAWVSGFRAKLDSINVFPKSYYLKPKTTQSKRWVLSAGVNMGYNPFTRRFEPTIGVNVGVKLREW